MYGARSDVADEQVDEGVLPRTTALKDGAEPGVEETEREYLGPPPPTPATSFLGLKSGLKEVAVRKGVEVEAGEREDDVE